MVLIKPNWFHCHFTLYYYPVPWWWSSFWSTRDNKNASQRTPLGNADSLILLYNPDARLCCTILLTAHPPVCVNQEGEPAEKPAERGVWCTSFYSPPNPTHLLCRALCVDSIYRARPLALSSGLPSFQPFKSNSQELYRSGQEQEYIHCRSTPTHGTNTIVVQVIC